MNINLTNIQEKFTSIPEIFSRKSKPKADQEFHINPRFRAYGKARIDLASRIHSQEEWDTLWKPSANPFPFTWGGGWKHCLVYNVKDFAAEIGFFTDILGFPVNAFGSDYAEFTGPLGEFCFAVIPAPDDESCTTPGAFRMQFMLKNIIETTQELKRRGVIFEQEPGPVQEGSRLYVVTFRTPHGIYCDLFGEVNELGY